MIMREKSNEFQRGNALFLILLAVGLFAALSYAVTQSQGGSSASMGQEQYSILASDVMEYAKQLEAGVNIIKQNGYSENQLSFAHNDLTGYGTYDTSPETEIFNPKGGGASYKKFPRATSDDWIFTARNKVINVGNFGEISDGNCVSGNNARCSDLVAILPNISKDLCLAINKNLGIGQPSDGNPPKDDGNVTLTKFTGAFISNTGLGDKSTDGELLWGRPTGCFEGDNAPASGTYHFYHVLLAR